MFNKTSVSAAKFNHLAWGAVLALTLVGCSLDGTDSTNAQSFATTGTAPPVISGIPGTSVTAGRMYRYLPHSSDPNSRVLAYDIVNKPEWATFSDTNGELAGRPDGSDVGTTPEIEIGVSNGTTRATVGPFRIRVMPQATHDPSPPATIAGTPAASVIAGKPYLFKPTVTDPSGEHLSFAIVNRPAWASFDTATGTLSGTPTNANVGAFAHILISVDANATPVSLPEFAIQVQAAADNAPTISGTPATTVAAGGHYAFVPVAGDPNGNALSFSILNAPPWASFNASTGALSGTAPSSTNGSVFSNIVIGVSDGTLSASLPAFSIEVRAAADNAPTISGTPATTVAAGGHYAFVPVASDPNGNALSFSILNAPPWASFNASTGALSGTAPSTAQGSVFSNIVIGVSDGTLSASLPAFSIEVRAAVDNAPTISGTPATTVAAGGHYAFVPVASDPNGNALTFSILNAPPWASFNAGTGQLSGTAPSSTNGSVFSNIVIGVSDGTLSASLPAFSIEVQANGGGTPGAIKFHPGHYIELDGGSGGGGLTGWLATINSLRGAPGVKGVMLIQAWSDLEFAQDVYTQGSGSNAQGFAMIDQLLAACKNAGLQFILGYEDRMFGAAQTYSARTSFGQLPGYFDTLNTASGAPGYHDAPSGTTFMDQGLVMIAKVEDPAVTARAIALVSAYGHRYDANPNFEMFRTPETANAAFPSSSQYDQYVTQLQAWMAAARAAFPHTGLSVSANFMDTPAQFTALFSTAITYSVGMGGPDTWPAFTRFSGTSNLVFTDQYGGTDYRGTLPWISEVQQPDEDGHRSPSPLATFNFAMSGDPSTGGSTNPNYFIWALDATYQGPNAFTNPQILAFVASVNGAINSRPPSVYK